MAEWTTIQYEFLNAGEPLSWQPVYVYYSDTDQLKTLFIKGYNDLYGNTERIRWPNNTAEPDKNIISSQAVFKALYRVMLPSSKQNFASNKGSYEKAPRAKKIIYSGKTALNMGMFMTRDKVPFISYLHKLDGVLMPSAKVILEGSSNKIVLQSDTRGIIAEYVPADEYTKALIISKNNIVYELTELTTSEENEYLFNMKVKRLTRANVPFRQIHRNFT